VLEAAAGGAELLGLDRDGEALAECEERLAGVPGKAHLRRLPFSRFEEALDEMGWDEINGACLDLGVSSLQLDRPERGFSFVHDGPLDMRMNADGTEKAARELVNRASERDLKLLLGRLGEEPMGGRIARAVVEARKEAPIESTGQLAEIVRGAYPPKMRRTARRDPATRTFQALRMAVNRELEELEEFLAAVPGRLAERGRLVVISFHSLEDRLVKNAFRNEARGCDCLPGAPCVCGKAPRLRILTKKPVGPSEEEKEYNPRSRSAKLRAAERLPREAAA
jgi:16S rRNA (cytosine1402-N4)-methyltransferase